MTLQDNQSTDDTAGEPMPGKEKIQQYDRLMANSAGRSMRGQCCMKTNAVQYGTGTAQKDLQYAWTAYSTAGGLRHGMKTMQRQTVLQKPERPMHGMQGDLYPWIAKYEDNAWTATQEDQCISIPVCS